MEFYWTAAASARNVLDIENIDICLISETHYTNESFIRFKGYKVYHTIHPQNAAKGGSAVIIRETIMHHQALECKTEEFQIKTKTYDVMVTSVYCPPRHAINKEQYLDFLSSQGDRFIIGGDFNAKHIHWGSRLTNTKGRKLIEAMTQLKCESHSTGKPTYWPTDKNKIPDLIDFFVVRNISTNYIQVDEAWDMNSDHSPILLTLSDTIIHKENAPRLINRLTDWQSFRLDLENAINLSVPLRTEEQLDEEVELFVSDIQ